MASTEASVDRDVAEGSSYELIRKRLETHGQALRAAAESLNAEREATFGKASLGVAGRSRVRTENNCVPRDIVRVGDLLVLGYNVFIGLRPKTAVSDVFGLYRVVPSEGEDKAFEVEALPVDGSFLAEKKFVDDFTELYAYYKNARLLKLDLQRERLCATFQIGERVTDVRVLRWQVSNDGSVKYIDNRGERDVQLPPSHDFEWRLLTRDDQVDGAHPHFNVLDQIFVDAIGGDLTVKVENNTESGRGLYREPVDDRYQGLSDGEYRYASVGGVILLKIRPYREEAYRYLIYNPLTESVARIDQIARACVTLPEDHGLVFPGGYYLATGEAKTFSDAPAGLAFEQAIRSPNGEDVLYVFYEPQAGLFALFSYNLIRKELANPIYCHGYTFLADGRALLFSSDDEPKRVHAIVCWDTPYYSDEHAQSAPEDTSFMGRIGNAELVRGVSDVLAICRRVDGQSPSRNVYEALIRDCDSIFDAHYWLAEPASKPLASAIGDVRETAETIVDEFEKVQAIRARASEAVAEAQAKTKQALDNILPTSWTLPQQFVGGLDSLRSVRGHLATLRDVRYINGEKLDELDTRLATAFDELAERTVTFLNTPEAFEPYNDAIARADEAIVQAQSVAELEPVEEELATLGEGLDLLNDVLATLKVADATERTRLLESISEAYGQLNQVRARARHRHKDLASGEAVAEFGALFGLFDQSVTNALADADSPERCDDQLSRLMVQLEELESRFADFDEFLSQILAKRDETYETFEARKQALLDARQRRVQTLAQAADRILDGVDRRLSRWKEPDEVHTYFSSDAMVAKLRDLIAELRELDASVRADDVETRLKAGREQALRQVRDKQDIFEDGGDLIRFGKHRFTVNTQPLELTILQRDDGLNIHLTGTDFYQPLDHPELEALGRYWSMDRVSETPEVYRAEYLAFQIIEAAEQGLNDGDKGWSADRLGELVADPAELASSVRKFAAERFAEGYEKGIHDADATQILIGIWPLIHAAGLLRFPGDARALASFWWSRLQSNKQAAEQVEQIQQWAQSSAALAEVFGHSEAQARLKQQLAADITHFVEETGLPQPELAPLAASYLAEELAAPQPRFATSGRADDLFKQFEKQLDRAKRRQQLDDALARLAEKPADQWSLALSWAEAFVKQRGEATDMPVIPELASLLVTTLDREVSHVSLNVDIDGIMGEHPRLSGRSLALRLDEFIQRLHRHHHVVAPGYREFLATRQKAMASERKRLNLEAFKARPLSSFVRNQLINEVYLPIIGDNLAKQMGAAGDARRTDLMGLLLLISPPGYGKTTLMEYVGDRLGLTFVKVNGPALGHGVKSLDPANAPDSAARTELEKLNLALAMANNVMLYVDDIQHTHPEFLQKFISLCDGTRRIEGVWNGEPRTFDLRGKKFCVVMAGNPYTEAGEAFSIPDMLANRADIYNLGDVLSGREAPFARSYIENSLTSNAVLAPLATRDMGDVDKLIRYAQGETSATTDLSYGYSQAEIDEMSGVLKKMFSVRDVILKVNAAYIESAATDDRFRTEPPFRLQGSYRNMNKMGEKISGAMTQVDVDNLIADHYLGEAQTLTNGAEENLLKLKALIGSLTEKEAKRWAAICKEFQRRQAMGGQDAGPVAQIANSVSGVVQRLEGIEAQLSAQAGEGSELAKPLVSVAESIAGLKADMSRIGNIKTELVAAPEINQAIDSALEQLAALAKSVSEAKVQVEVVNQPVPGIDVVLQKIADSIEVSMLPMLSAMKHKLAVDEDTWERVKEIQVSLTEGVKGVKK